MNHIILISGTLAIITFSWFFSIKHGRYHGIYRFFSFESIFILLILNAHLWFRDPFSVNQLFSWIFLFGSIYPGIAGYFLLRNFGKSEKSFENTTVLVKTGIYKYIRHPLYCSLLLLGTGIMLKELTVYTIILGAINATGIFFTARTEEGEMIARFGDAYKDYMKETKMFIPYIL